MLAVVLIIITLAILGAVLAEPFRRPAEGGERPERGELEEAKEAKYRELRDLELDWRTGKLSPADYERTRGVLRAEAARLLEQGDAAAG